jgi:coenzyme PQQ synthesis protein D (PqqD)
MLTLATRLCPKQDDIAAEILDGEAIIINLATGSYYAMSKVGALVWQSIEQQASVDEIAARVSASYDVAIERARTDLLALATRLLDEGIVRIADAPRSMDAVSVQSERQPYETPELSAYTDMRNLLALDPPIPSVDALSPALRGGPSKA